MPRMIVINGCPYACIHQETMNFENLNKIFSDEYEIIYSKNVVFVNIKKEELEDSLKNSMQESKNELDNAIKAVKETEEFLKER